MLVVGGNFTLSLFLLSKVGLGSDILPSKICHGGVYHTCTNLHQWWVSDSSKLGVLHSDNKQSGAASN